MEARLRRGDVKKTKKGAARAAAVARVAAAAAAAEAAAVPLTDAEYDGVLKSAAQHVDELNYAGAALLYEEALKSRPGDTRVMDALGEALYNLGGVERAGGVLARSAAAAPADGYSKWMYRGQIYEGASSAVAYSHGIDVLAAELAAAAAAGAATAAAAPRLRRELSDAYATVVELHMTDLCDEADAKDICSRYAALAVETDVTNAEAHRVAASLLAVQGENEAALAHVLKAAELVEALCAAADAAGDDDDDDGGEGGGGGGGGGGAGAGISGRCQQAACGGGGCGGVRAARL